MTQGELSRRMYGDIANRTLVQKWVNGRFEPGYASLHMMREAIGCTWEELMGE